MDDQNENVQNESASYVDFLEDDGMMDYDSISSYLAQQLEDFGENSLSYLTGGDESGLPSPPLPPYTPFTTDTMPPRRLSAFEPGSFHMDDGSLSPLLGLLTANRRYQQKLREQLALIEDGLKMNKELNRWLKMAIMKTSRKRKLMPDFSRQFITASGETPPESVEGAAIKPYLDEYVKVYTAIFKFTENEQRDLAKGIRFQSQQRLVDVMVEEEKASGVDTAEAVKRAIRSVQRMSQRELEESAVGAINWQKVALTHGSSHNDLECMIQWTTLQSPLINHEPFSPDEMKLLQNLVSEKHGEGGKWREIAHDMGNGRLPWQCFAAYQDIVKREATAMASGKWTPEEDEALIQAVRMYGDKDAWRDVEEQMDGRTAAQCLHRWSKALDPRKHNGRWTEEEDAWLLAGVRRVVGCGDGPISPDAFINWAQVQGYVPHRTDVQCRERYMNVLNPCLKHEEFSPEEDQRLRALVEELGEGKWAQIASALDHNRTDNQCRRRWLLLKKEEAVMKAKAAASRGKGRGRGRGAKVGKLN